VRAMSIVVSPMSPEELVNTTPRCADGQTVPHRPGPHVHHPQKAFERLVARSGVKFRGHDLRRTAASLMVVGGVPRLVVSKILTTSNLV